MRPVFEAAPQDPAAPPVQQYLPLNTRNKVRSMLAEGVRPAEIAKQCSISAATVYRERERMNR